MVNRQISDMDKVLARVCGFCPMCRHARREQKGTAFHLVKRIENGICPFCRAYEKVYGRKSYEP